MSINFKELKQSQAHNSAIYKCKLNKDHEYLMTGSQDRSIKVKRVIECVVMECGIIETG